MKTHLSYSPSSLAEEGFPRTGCSVPTRSQSLFTPSHSSIKPKSARNLRARYTRFRILVIGRANAGKTTLLQRVCNTTEDPCIYYDKFDNRDNNNNLVSSS